MNFLLLSASGQVDSLLTTLPVPAHLNISRISYTDSMLQQHKREVSLHHTRPLPDTFVITQRVYFGFQTSLLPPPFCSLLLELEKFSVPLIVKKLLCSADSMIGWLCVLICICCYVFVPCRLYIFLLQAKIQHLQINMTRDTRSSKIKDHARSTCTHDRLCQNQSDRTECTHDRLH